MVEEFLLRHQHKMRLRQLIELLIKGLLQTTQIKLGHKQQPHQLLLIQKLQDLRHY
jgi:hypothetical protein